MMRYGWPYGMNGYGYGGWLPDLIIWIVIIVAVIALIKFLTRHDDHYRRGMKHMLEENTEDGDSAMDILKERYVKGEISKKEFEEMKKDISD